MSFDLILKGGRVVDPSQNMDKLADVAFAGGKVAAIGEGLTDAKTVRDVKGRIVTPGLIDIHTHVYWGGTSLGIDPVALALRSAVTTVIDAGSAGAGNFHGFRRHIIEPSPIRILAYLNISYPGIFAFSKPVMVGESTDVRLLEPNECVRVAGEHKDLIVGVKVRVGGVASGPAGATPLYLAIDAADAAGLPMMAHLDKLPPARHEVLPHLRRGDVLTHCFRPVPNAPVQGDGRVRAEVLEARARGVLFDIGHGGGSFAFRTAREALAHGFPPDIISSDAHILSVDGPAFDLLVTMSKMLCLGMSLNDVVRCCTSAPARAMLRDELGTLKVGGIGDASVLDLVAGDFEYVDVVDEMIVGKQRLFPAGMVVAGKWMDTTS
ncbi:MAG: amidohydrolase/deacetylase family metallohydrolase [Alphaproteobacteria bacterium]|nr:amidohydrolase/deacetylase family metallohydrolase [Alphaproteobacteria bacterium]